MTKEESFLKNSYPIILTPDAGGYVVEIPDFAIGTQGDSIPEAMEMVRDAIGLMGIDMEDDGKSLPIPSTLEVSPKARVTLSHWWMLILPSIVGKMICARCGAMCLFPAG